MLESIENALHRLTALERGVGTLNKQLNSQTAQIQTINEAASQTVVPPQTNLLRNGDFDLSRNRYLFDSDFTDADATTVDADVSEEVAFWYTATPDTAKETRGSVGAASTALTITTPLFIAGDAGKEIVIEGAGAAGADLITTITGAPGSTTTATLAVAATTAVSNARVRFRLRKLAEDSTDANSDADNATNTTLKTSTHSRYATTINDPDYNKTDGWARLGSQNWLCAPMPKNYFKPSTTYIATFIYRLRAAVAGATTYPITPFVGLWDNSPGRRQFLEGKATVINAVVVGTPASTVSREYYIVFYTNWGEKVGSEIKTLSNAPSNTSFSTNSVYVYLSWKLPLGTIRTEIYRRTGAEYKLVGLPVGSDFRDTNGQANVTQEPQAGVANYPSVEYTRPKAFIQTTTQNFAAPRTDIWQFVQLGINVPFDYSAAGLTDKQWLVIGLTAAVPGVPNAIEIDKVSIDDKYGAYSPCSLDEAAKRGLSSAPVTGSQGNVGAGPPGTIVEPGSTNNCPTFESFIAIEDTDGERVEMQAIDLVNGCHELKIINRKGEAVKFTARVSESRQVIYCLTTNGGRILKASASHPCFENESDGAGKPLQDFVCGDTILARNTTERVLTNIRQLDKEYVVQISLDGEEKGFWVNGYGGHNLKSDALLQN